MSDKVDVPITITRRLLVEVQVTSNPNIRILDNDTIDDDEEKELYTHEEMATFLSNELVEHFTMDLESDSHESFIVDDLCENKSIDREMVDSFTDLVKDVKVTVKELE